MQDDYTTAREDYQNGLLSQAELDHIVRSADGELTSISHTQKLSSHENVPSSASSRTIPPRVIVIGSCGVIVYSEDFINGYQAGLLSCILDCRLSFRGQYELTNESITAIIMERLEDVDHSEQYNMGYCIGWIATFATKGTKVVVPTNPANPT